MRAPAHPAATLAALAATLALTAFPAGTGEAKVKAKADACSASAVAQTRQRIGTAVTARVGALRKLATTLDAWTHVTADHRAVLNQLISTDQTALTQLATAVGRQGDCRLLGVDGRQVVDDFRIYSLVLPQAHLSMAADSGAYGASQLAAAQPDLRDLLQKVPAASQARAQALWADLVQETATAQHALTPVGDAVLRIDPDDFPSAAAELEKQVQAVANGGKSLGSALSDAEELELLAP
jgi:hypothetical protein